MTDAKKLAESLRAMRRNAQMHYSTATTYRHSITMDSTRLGDLTDAADLIEALSAELAEWKQNARNVMDADLVQRAALEQERELSGLRTELARMNALAEKLQAQKPVAWVRYASDGSIHGPLLDAQIEDVRRAFWTPLIAAEWANRDVQAAQGGADDPHLSARFEVVR